MVFTATGKAPFGGDTIVATLNRVINHEADLGGLPDELREIVAGCLDKDQTLRPTADGLLKRLLGHPADEGEASEEVLAEGAQAATMDLTQAEEPVRNTRRRSVVAGGLAVLGAAAAFLIFQFGFTPDGDVTPTSAATSPTPTPTPTLSTGSALLDRIRRRANSGWATATGCPGVSVGHPPRGFEIEVAEHIAKALRCPKEGSGSSPWATPPGRRRSRRARSTW